MINLEVRRARQAQRKAGRKARQGNPPGSKLLRKAREHKLGIRA